MKKGIVYLLLSLFIIATHYGIYKSGMVKNLDYKIYDLSKEYIDLFRDEDAASNVVIVDIDERSLNTIGQWPWSRIMLATLLSKISSASPSAIAVDIIFPEKDRTSPNELRYFYKNYFGLDVKVDGIPQQLQDNDAIFAKALNDSSSVMSLYLSQKNISDNAANFQSSLNIPTETFELENYPYLLANIPNLSAGVKEFGFINTKVDEDGILRRYSLLKKYQQNMVPSLSLATLLSIDSNFKVLENNNFEIMNHQFKTDNSAKVLLNYYTQKWYKKVSALDILSDKTDASALRGKIILIGSSATALHDQVVISSGKNIAGVQVHATMIDNILHDNLLVQPQDFDYINILISLFLTLILVLLLFEQENQLIVALVVTVLLTGLVLNLYMLSQGVYISFGYLLIPFLLHFFLISIIFIFIDTYDRKEFSEELNRSQIAFMDSMSHVAEVHDFETGAHIIRTKKYIKLLAEYIYSKGLYKEQLSQRMIQMMYLTAPMHDIGKVGIADSILKKEGKLTDMEYEVMKSHSELGKHIINNAISGYKENDFLVMARNIAHYHHEKWDGSGYPEGLKGEEIPLEGRFMAIADVYDALVSKRIYKEAFSFYKTNGIITEGRGTHFDPVLVDAFIEISEKFQEIAETYTD